MGRFKTWDVVAGTIAFVVPLAIYLASIGSAVSFWDTGEMQTVPYILGIAHPTGFPAFTLIGWFFTHVVPFGSVAWRMSAMSALAMAFAARGVYALAREFEIEPPIAAAAALLFSVGDTVWSRGARTEVHALACAFIVWTLVNTVAYSRRPGSRRLLYAALCFGLGAATHPLIVLLVPGLLVLALRRWKSLDLVTVASVAGIIVACAALYAYLPVRSAIVTAQHLDPLSKIGLPPGRPFWDYDHPSTLDGFHREISGSDFDVNEGASGIFAFAQYGQSFAQYSQSASAEFGTFALVLVIAGIVFALRDSWYVTLGTIVATALAIPFALNFHDEADPDRYLLSSYAMLAVFASYGARALLVALTRGRGVVTQTIATVALVASAAYLVSVNRHEFSQRDDQSAAQWVARVKAVTPPSAIIVSFWAYATPLAYASYVEHGLDDRLVEPQWIGNDVDYLPEWLKSRPVYAVAQSLPQVDGYRFEPVDNGYPFIYKVSR